MVFCNESEYGIYEPIEQVTILILIDGFLQYEGKNIYIYRQEKSHNPYFNRWFSAMKIKTYLLGL